jgi:hypothetical protein
MLPVRTRDKEAKERPAIVVVREETMALFFVAQHLDPAKDQQDYDNENGKAQSPGWVVTPFSTVRPTWKSAYQS